MAASKIYEKILTQTTSSKYKQSRAHSPKRSESANKKSKRGNKSTVYESKASKSMRKARLGNDKFFMAQSMNIPHLEPMLNEEIIRNSSQQLSTNNN